MFLGEVSREVGKAWKALGAEEKKKYEEMARKDKLRFSDEMESYDPPKGIIYVRPPFIKIVRCDCYIYVLIL